METQNFNEVAAKFETASLDEKIRIYTTMEGLSQDQYMALLRMFPREHIGKLETALNAL